MAAMLYQLHWVDYLVFVIFMMITPAIGVFFAFSGGRQKTTKEYFSGNNNLGVFPASVSIVVSFMSAIMTLGVPAETFLYGGHYLLGGVGSTLGSLMSLLFLVPIFYPLKLVSVNRYIEMRYESKYPKYIATCQSVIIGVIYSAMVIFAPSSAMATMMGISVWIVILVSCIVAIFYTTIGGIKAVIWTDTFQCFCMLGGLLLIAIQGIRYSGGIKKTWELNVEGKRLDIFNFDPNPAVRLTIWNMILAMAFDCTGTYGFSQSAVQRYSNVGSLNKAKLTVLLSGIGNIFMYVLPVFAGLAIYAYYATLGCDPLSQGVIDNPNQLVPYFVMETLNYPGIPGFFLASLSAGALSSVSSALNSSAANIWDDLLRPRFPNISPSRAACISKLVVIGLGCVATVFCFLVTYLGGTLIQISYGVAGVVLVPSVGMFFLGIMCPWINNKGIVAGAAIGFGVVFWIGAGQFLTISYQANALPMVSTNCTPDFTNISHFVTDRTPNAMLTTPHLFSNNNFTEFFSEDTVVEGSGFFSWFYNISYMWYRTVGVFIMLIVGSIVSLLTGRKQVGHTETRLLCVCYKGCATKNEAYTTCPTEEKKVVDSQSWTQDKFYSVRSNPLQREPVKSP